jgi:hypothetical protein
VTWALAGRVPFALRKEHVTRGLDGGETRHLGMTRCLGAVNSVHYTVDGSLGERVAELTEPDYDLAATQATGHAYPIGQRRAKSPGGFRNRAVGHRALPTVIIRWRVSIEDSPHGEWERINAADTGSSGWTRM